MSSAILPQSEVAYSWAHIDQSQTGTRVALSLSGHCYLRGVCRLSVLRGEVSVNGRHVTRASGLIPIAMPSDFVCTLEGVAPEVPGAVAAGAAPLEKPLPKSYTAEMAEAYPCIVQLTRYEPM
ncbi:hypothetical protein KIPB_015692 [Kipferlia bialata]|uniref:Uncharacterized protein n=1 Tax=Kipferlia bialata TaxID=797122 RepID=A0A391NWH8_9EUKA|nr:hypothetical protein KIPB_015692 [Kipferlia bialata]|eukprot:g15692.t1